MGFKVKHYAAKTVPANSSLEWELILLSLSLVAFVLHSQRSAMMLLCYLFLYLI